MKPNFFKLESPIPTLEELQKYNVNRPGQIEGIRQSLYDFQTYPAAGTTSLAFFQVPIGQSGKTKADTNMEIAGSLPAPKRFFVESIEVHFYPGGTLDRSDPSLTLGFADDVYSVAKSGFLDFFIGSKSYLTEGPIGRFPPKTGIKLFANNSSTLTGQNIRTEYATFGGVPYKLDPGILLVPTQNFNITLNWPVAVALPSGNPARIGVVLNGILYRNSQ